MIIASLSTIPDRLDSLLYVLKELKTQSVLPDFIYISLSKFYPRSNKHYPDVDLNNLKSFLHSYSIPNKLVIYENDIGPVLKLITPLKNIDVDHPSIAIDSSFIFTLDDDTPIYNKTIESLLISHNKNPNAVYAFSGTREDRFFHAELLPEGYDYFVIDVLGGYRGVLYPLYLFKDKFEFYTWCNTFIVSSKKHGLIAMHDDHIFSYYFKYKGIPRHLGYCPFTKDFNYTPIQNANGIFNDSNNNTSINIIKQTIINQKLDWVVNNPY